MSLAVADADAAAPADLCVRLAPGVLVGDAGRLLVGGAPSRLIRLSEPGAALLAGWRSGAPIGSAGAAPSLARRLLDGGVLVPEPAPVPTADLTVVVPAHGRERALARARAP
jgi:hypothetical protein